jgi:acetyl-CoA carboxylase biotin carboxylase subunit
MNTRIQVEHPVTEMRTDVDLVKAQILIAAGARLSEVLPAVVEQRGHVLECRVNAEHPEKFTPSAGKITAFHTPGEIGVRVDTAMYAEAVVPPYYDSLIAKLIVRGKDRPEAIARMARALDMFIVEGIHTSIPLHRRIMRDPEFIAGRIDTKFMERFLAETTPSQRPPAQTPVAAEARTETATVSTPALSEPAAASPRKRRAGKRLKESG